MSWCMWWISSKLWWIAWSVVNFLNVYGEFYCQFTTIWLKIHHNIKNLWWISTFFTETHHNFLNSSFNNEILFKFKVKLTMRLAKFYLKLSRLWFFKIWMNFYSQACFQLTKLWNSLNFETHQTVKLTKLPISRFKFFLHPSISLSCSHPNPNLFFSLPFFSFPPVAKSFYLRNISRNLWAQKKGRRVASDTHCKQQRCICDKNLPQQKPIPAFSTTNSGFFLALGRTLPFAYRVASFSPSRRRWRLFWRLPGERRSGRVLGQAEKFKLKVSERRRNFTATHHIVAFIFYGWYELAELLQGVSDDLLVVGLRRPDALEIEFIQTLC